MFFFLPWGHDQPVYERPWLTYSLVLACTIVFLFTWSSEQRAEQALDLSVEHVGSVLDEHPDARVRLTVQGLPRRIEELLTPLIETKEHRVHTSGDAELETAVRELVAALNRMPAFAYGFQPGAPRAGRALSHMFVHADVFHLLGNMLFLWLAGGVLECFWRRWAYALLYFASGFAGLLAHIASSPSSLTPVIGASGAIAGLLGAFVVGYPRTRIKVAWLLLIWFPPFWGTWRVPAWVLIPLWAGVELVSAYLGSEDSGVAHWAHVGGFACGALVAWVARRSNLIATDAGRDEVPAEIAKVERREPQVRSVAPLPREQQAAALPLPPPREERAPSLPPRATRPIEVEAIELTSSSDDDDVIER